MYLFKNWLVCLFLFPLFVFAQPDVQLAKVYSDDTQIQDYLVSEKYDGIRGIWTGTELLTRQGNIINAPAWFTENLPPVWLDGELWSKHNDFAYIMSTVSKQVPVDSEWQNIYYMVFDAPDKARSLTFYERYQRYTTIVTSLNLPHVLPVEQFSVNTTDELNHLLTSYVGKGAEGLMLHRKLARFESGRTDNLLKLKPHMDAEAEVVGILKGSGKYQDMMGSLIVEMPSGLRFKIGTGFTDKERENPPKVGQVITYKYHGFTDRGVPRFASFMRIRDKGF
ncbi:DNA ligase-1 [Marinomonas alcarazii]|uniref:DNA ligase-1 n=1 Tax=Marinomonas alcarazii TaxID=491949 RepID=A0A318V4I9_9GAMM|nr:DNA ligase [Marinomonas alcarazii]PYF82943.1 DNA ligase-1 [Marinomonas alcarazii]